MGTENATVTLQTGSTVPHAGPSYVPKTSVLFHFSKPSLLLSTAATTTQIPRPPGEALHSRDSAGLLLPAQPERDLPRSQARGWSTVHAIA